MYMKLKNNKLYGLGLFLLVIFCACTIQIGGNAHTAEAWCNAGTGTGGQDGTTNVGPDTKCAQENWDSIPMGPGDTRTTRRGITYNDYQKLIDKCRDWANTELGCANAISNCMQSSVDVSLCKNTDEMRKVDGATCGWGTTLGCGGMNDAAIAKVKDDVTKKVKADGSCSMDGVDTRKITAVTQRENECASKFDDTLKKNNCNAPANAYDNGRNYLQVQSDIDNYQKCVDTAYYKSASNSAECKSRGGIYMDQGTKDPNSPNPNTLDSGCYKQASDLTNPQACAAGAKATGKDLQWKQTNKEGDPAAWGCVDPTAKPDDATKDPNKIADGPTNCDSPVVNKDSCIQGATNKCGTSETNIIGCSGTGGQAIGDVLKIFVMVLSFGVGIAAVGGLAYSAIQYAGASDNESHVSAAKERIRNIIIGLLLYGFLLVIVNWLLPGGIFS